MARRRLSFTNSDNALHAPHCFFDHAQHQHLIVTGSPPMSFTYFAVETMAYIRSQASFRAFQIFWEG